MSAQDDGARVSLTVSAEVEDAVADAIGEGLDRYNVAAAGPYNREPLWIVARDHGGRIVGGLKGQADYAWLYIDWLWVEEDMRRRGLGRRLMEEAEAFADGRDCVGCFVQSATFQAPEFYKRLGYREFGRLDDLLPGHAIVWLCKRLRRPDRALTARAP